MTTKDLILERFSASDSYLKDKRTVWSTYENLFHSKLDDAVSQKTGSQVFDPKLSSLILEREARVMAQLPVGKVRAISKNDEGASQLMNLVLDKYVVPNANAQFDLLTKLRMVDRYSNIYGNYFVMVDWDVRKDGYIGPDMWLLPMRDVFPQVGAVSLEDSDYVIVRTWRPISFFESLSKQQGYKNIPSIVAKLKQKTGSKQSRDADHKSEREQDAYPQDNPAKNGGYFEVLSMYERDRWVDYCVDAQETFRDIKNPHEDGELPIVNKYSIPLMDDFMAMGDMERGAPMQNTLNSIWNLYLDACKMSIFPPTLINKDAIADPNSLKWSFAAKWLVRGVPSGAAQVLNMSPQGTNTFNNVYQVVTSSLLNMFGTSSTQTTSSTDPGFGKTPQALEMQAARENSKDNVDRFYMEQFVTKVFKKFVNLISKKAKGNIQFRMFDEEIEEISKAHPELKEMFDEKTGKMSIDPKKTGSMLYDYQIISGSTYAIDQKAQQQSMIGLFTQLTNPAIYQLVTSELQKEQKQIKLGELFTRIISNSGIQDWDEIVVDLNEDPESALKQHAQQLQQALGMGAGMPPQAPGMPPEGMQQQMPAEMAQQPIAQPNEQLSNQTQ